LRVMQRAHVEGILHMWAHDAHGCSETTVNSWRYNQSGTSNVKGRTPIDNIISYYTSQEAWHGMYAVAKLRRVEWRGCGCPAGNCLEAYPICV